MARVVTKIGDIFCAKLDEGKKYFQYIANDLNQLNSDVIRVFKREFQNNDNPQLTVILNDEVDFYAHCVVSLGVKLSLWEKVGSVQDVGAMDNVFFRGSADCGIKVGEEPSKVSSKWYIWKLNDEKVTQVGKLENENRKAEIGVVVNPYDILDRMKTGEYKFKYPGFE